MMFFDNLLNDKDDRFYFMYAFACRAWASFLFFVFAPLIIYQWSNFSFNIGQIYLLTASYILMLLTDFTGAYMKAFSEYRAIRRREISHHGLKKYK